MPRIQSWSASDSAKCKGRSTLCVTAIRVNFRLLTTCEKTCKGGLRLSQYVYNSKPVKLTGIPLYLCTLHIPNLISRFLLLQLFFLSPQDRISLQIRIKYVCRTLHSHPYKLVRLNSSFKNHTLDNFSFLPTLFFPDLLFLFCCFSFI